MSARGVKNDKFCMMLTDNLQKRSKQPLEINQNVNTNLPALRNSVSNR